MSNTKVLVVDDEYSVRWALSEMLRGWGYEPVEAGNAREAREGMSAHRPVAALLDVNLPDDSGLDLLSWIKHFSPRTFTIMMTGDTTVDNVVASLRRGADDFLAKPVNIAELQFSLRRGIRNKSSRAGETYRPRPRILIVADSDSALDSLASMLGHLDVELTGITSLAELNRACNDVHDLALVDLHPGLVNQSLVQLRANRHHRDIPLLVNSERLGREASLAGVLPKHRAMPCTRAEMVELITRRANPVAAEPRRRPLL